MFDMLGLDGKRLVSFACGRSTVNGLQPLLSVISRGTMANGIGKLSS